MLAPIRSLFALWRRLTFRLWAAELGLRMRLAGGRLELEAPHGALLEGRPAVKAFPLGAGRGKLVLRIGRGARIGRSFKLEINARDENALVLGDDAYVMDGVRVILRGGRVEIGARTNVRDGVWLKSDGVLRIGTDVVVSQYTAVHCTERIEMGDFSALAERVSVLDSDHGFDGSDSHFRTQPLKIGPVGVGRNTFVAANAVILRGARIGPNCLVAANSVVRGGEYGAGSLLAGAPAKVVQTRGDEGAGTST